MTRTIIYTVIFLAAWMCPAVGAFTAYDCQHPNARFEPVSLVEPEKCPDPINDYSDPVNVTVQLLQVNHRRDVPVYQCRVEVTRQVTVCGFDSISYGSDTVQYRQQVPVPIRGQRD